MLWREFAQDAARGGNRIVFSCRSLDYSVSLSSPDLRVLHVTVQPMNPGQVKKKGIFRKKTTSDQREDPKLEVLTLCMYNIHLKFDWDEEKNKANIKKHGLDFADAEEVFDGPMFIAPDIREDYGEDRWIGIGNFRGRIVVIAFVERGDETIRIISMRKALRHERKYYEETIRDEFSAN